MHLQTSHAPRPSLPMMESSAGLLPSSQWTADYVALPDILPQAMLHDAPRAIHLISQASVQVRQEQEALNAAQAKLAKQQAHIETQSTIKALQDRIAALETAPQLSPPAPSPGPAAPSPIIRSVKLPAPSFDGKPENLRPFLASLANKLHGNADHFRSEADQVAFAYACLSEAAADRLRPHFRHLFQPGLAPEITTVTEFLALLKQYFQDPARQQKADAKLTALAQRGTPFHEFISVFEDVISESSWADQDPKTWKTLLLPKLSDDLADVVIKSDAVPESYDSFVLWLRGKDTLIQARRATRPARSSLQRPAVLQTPASVSVSVSAPPTTAPTTAQGGDRMDLDAQSQQKGPDGRLTAAARDARRLLGRCFRCNKPGHLSQSCPLSSRSAPAVRSLPSADTEQLKG